MRAECWNSHSNRARHPPDHARDDVIQIQDTAPPGVHGQVGSTYRVPLENSGRGKQQKIWNHLPNLIRDFYSSMVNDPSLSSFA
ncbi:hypothetical protein RRG08_042961 [Elysia crispata]|uniref:Uncharacterized protein n=1 Tax=Elysia crispata TaxID=231223 RepID=A0AAE1AY03_9GAST|nr:hypothetical protein RRG08_042961 [Elysia crispata]